MENKQTALEWYALQMRLRYGYDEEDMLSFIQAKQMEKEQIKEAWKDSIWHRSTEEVLEYSAEEYYNETYGK